MNEQISQEKKAELLLGHYNETFNHIMMHWKVRNRLFVYVLIMLALMALDAFSPDTLSNLVNAYIAKLLDCNSNEAVTFDFAVIGAAFNFLLLCLMVQYYQRSIHVDRQYYYIQRLEKQLCELLGSDAITREGKSYFSRKGVPEKKGQRPMFLKAVGPLYVYVFPAILTTLVIAKLAIDFRSKNQYGAVDYINILIVFAIIFYNILYIVWVDKRK